MARCSNCRNEPAAYKAGSALLGSNCAYKALGAAILHIKLKKIHVKKRRIELPRYVIHRPHLFSFDEKEI